MNNIVYVRHGESTNNKKTEDLKNLEQEVVNTVVDPPLTYKGQVQSNYTARHLFKAFDEGKYKKFHIIVSPYMRTQDTAFPFTKTLDLNKVPYTIYDMLESKEYTGTHKIIPNQLKDLGVKHDDNWSTFIDRVVQFNNFLKQKVTEIGCDELIVIFGHGLFLSVLLSFQSVQERFIGTQHTAIELANCSVSLLRYSCNDITQPWTINCIGSTSHIPRNFMSANVTLF